MKKNKKILLTSICASAVALVAIPTTIGILPKSVSGVEIVDNNLKSSIVDSTLKVEGNVIKSDYQGVVVETKYTQDNSYNIYSKVWEISFDNVNWKKDSSLSESNHNLDTFTFQRKKEGNYYVRRTIVWQKGDNWSRKNSESFYVSRKLDLKGRTEAILNTSSIKFNFTFGLSASTDIIKFKLAETSSDFKEEYNILDQKDWSEPNKVATQIGNSSDYLWTKILNKQIKEKFYKLTLESKTKDGVHQAVALIFNTNSTEYEPIYMNVNKIDEGETFSEFSFNFPLNEGDKIKYKIVNFSSFGEIIEEEQKDFIEIEKIAEKTSYGWYTFSRSYAKVFTVYDKYDYYIYVSVLRKGSSVVSPGAYAFSVPPRIIRNKHIITNLLNDTNKMSTFLSLNGGFTLESIDKINKWSIDKKLEEFNNFIVSYYNIEEAKKEIKNIDIYFSKDEGSHIKLGIVYYLNNGYVFRDYNSLFRQFFYDVKKI